ncbi:MAG: hypothetical protein HYZ50_19235 [Deltaproteobacteria bacterium]|nr:hypothetical protein [Deltaproteobacteria bacterium]
MYCRNFIVAGTLFLSLFGAVLVARAAGVEPGDVEPLEAPRIHADLTVLYDAVNDTVAATVKGTCRGHQLLLGPLFFDPTTTFDYLVDHLKDSDFATEDHLELLNIHPSCIPPDEILVGFRIVEVIRFTVQTPFMAVVRVVLLPLHPKP